MPVLKNCREWLLNRRNQVEEGGEINFVRVNCRERDSKRRLLARIKTLTKKYNRLHISPSSSNWALSSALCISVFRILLTSRGEFSSVYLNNFTFLFWEKGHSSLVRWIQLKTKTLFIYKI